MKKYLLGMSAIAMLCATSCQDDMNLPGNVGESTTVAFNVSTPEIGTRSYSDGKTADVLQYAVYDAAGNLLPSLTKQQAIDITSKVELQLTTGNEYTVVFWAEAPEAPYTANFTTKLADANVEVSYAGAKSNDEKRDAFYAKHTFTVKGAQTENVMLYRPFAQLNIGTGDYTASTNAGYTPEYSYVKVPVSSTLNLNDGSVGAATVETFGVAKINKEETFPVDGYQYLAMNYLLVPADKSVVDVEFGYSETESGKAKTRKVGSVPVQRNYRTNIYGQLLTSDVDINVTIVPAYNGEFNNEGYFIEENANGETVAIVESANGLATIAEMINNGTLDGDTNIALEGNIDLSTLSLTRSGEVSNWTPIGTSEKPFTGAFDGKGFTIKNFNYSIIGDNEAWYVGLFGYAKDATIKNFIMENVTIYSEKAYFAEVGAVVGHLEGTSTLENITIKGDVKVEGNVTNVEASRIGAVIGGNNTGKITVNNVHVKANNGGYVKGGSHVGGIAGQLQLSNIFENCSSNVNVTAGQFFAGGIIGCAGQNDTYTNCNTTGDIAVVAGRSGNANDLYRVGGIAGGWGDGQDRVLTINNCRYDGVVSGKDVDGNVANILDCAGYVGRGYATKVGSTVVVNGAKYVYQGDGNYTINGLTPVSTANELVEALEANEGVFFLNDIKIDPANMSNAYGKTGINVKNGQTIDGNGYTLNIKGAGGTWDSGICTTGGLIKNLIVTGSFRGVFIKSGTEKVVLENVTLTGVTYTISCDQANYQGIEATNCTFNGWTSYAKTAGEAKFVNCSFGEGNGYKYCRPYSNTEFVNCTFCPGYTVDKTRATVTFTDCTWEE